MASLFAQQEPLSEKVTLYEAIARALKYNLDHKVSLMEEAVARGAHDLSKYSFLPTIDGQFGVSERNNASASSSKSVATQTESLEASQSSDRTSKTGRLQASWNALDFGVSYYSAKQSANQALVQEERRRKAIQNIIKDVRSAYWRAVAAERFITRIDRVQDRVERALAEAQAIENRNLQPPAQVLRYQLNLLQTRQKLQRARRRLVIARTELSALMNVRPGERYTLAVPKETEPALPALKGLLNALETHALLARPEVNEERYNKRISIDDVKKEILRMLPGLTFNASYNVDRNSYLVHNNWLEAGFLVTKNLLEVVEGPDRIALAKNREQLADARRMAINMAVLTQLNVAYQGYELSRVEYGVTSNIADIQDRLYSQTSAQNRSGTGNQKALVMADVETVMRDLDRALAYADLQDAFGRLLNTAGVHPLPVTVPASDIGTVAKAVEQYLKPIDRGELPLATLPEQTTVGQGENQDAPTFAAMDQSTKADETSPFNWIKSLFSASVATPDSGTGS